MKIILIKNHTKIGKIGDIKEVSAGYAQNFLFPQGLALVATVNNVNKIKARQSKKEQEFVVVTKKTNNFVSEIDGIKITVKAKANPQGTLFAAVSPKDVTAVLDKKGIKIAGQHLKLNKHIKEVGEHDLVISLDHGLEAKIKVIVENI